MKKAQVFCTMRELIADMNQKGDNGSLFERILAASNTIEHEIGVFVPVVETRKFSGRMTKYLTVGPVLSINSVVVNDLETTEYTLHPESPVWANGPYVKLKSSTYWCNSTIEVNGVWGKYQDTKPVLDSFSVDGSVETFDAENAALFDAGSVLICEDEQMLVLSGHGYKDSPDASAATSLLNGDFVSTDEIITVDDGSEFYPGEVLLIGNEDLLIRRIIGNDLTVERGWNNSPIEDHADNSVISVYRTFKVLRGVNGTSAVAHADKELAVAVIPEDVNWLCRQIAGLMMMKAASGFQGRTGNAATGESSYFSEFPPNQIARVKSHYSIKVL